MRLDFIRCCDVGLRLCLSAVVGGTTLSGCGENSLDVGEVRDLAVAERRWAERGFGDYAFVTRQTCFCSPELLLQVEVEVRGGQIASVRDVAADTLLSAELNSARYTIEDLFLIIRQAAGNDLVTDVAVTFDPTLGYPVSAAISYDPSILDAGGTYEVTAVRPLGAAPLDFQELVPGFSYPAWFTQQTGFVTDSTYFGAYSIQPVSGALYLGFGAARPASIDGALLSVFDQAGLTPIASLPEQGFLDMAAADETLLIPGVDPCCPDGWEAGNFYTYSAPTGLIKHRNLPNVIHSLRLWYDAPEDAVYVTTGSHRGDFATWTGEIWRSADFGASWSKIADSDDGVGDYRTTDIVRYQGRLYAISQAAGGICELIVQGNAGAPWSQVLPGHLLRCLHELVLFGNELIALDASRNRLHILSGQGMREVVLPFTVAAEAYNWAAVVGDHIFAIADDGRVLRSRDAITWDTVAESNLPLIIIRFWPHRSWLVLASRGSTGSVWRLRLCGIDPC